MGISVDRFLPVIIFNTYSASRLWLRPSPEEERQAPRSPWTSRSFPTFCEVRQHDTPW